MQKASVISADMKGYENKNKNMAYWLYQHRNSAVFGEVGDSRDIIVTTDVATFLLKPESLGLQHLAALSD